MGIAPTKEVGLVDSLNEKAYHFIYKSLDSAFYWAEQAYEGAQIYTQGKAAACNLKGFVYFAKADFVRAEQAYKEVYSITKSELELLSADVGLMRIFQRTLQNKAFYDYRNSAYQRMKRIAEDKDFYVDSYELKRINDLFYDFYVVSAYYYFSLSQQVQASAMLHKIEEEHLIANEENEMLYHAVKAAFLLNGNISISEKYGLDCFDLLYSVLRKAQPKGYSLHEAFALYNLAELLWSPQTKDLLQRNRIEALDDLQHYYSFKEPIELSWKAIHLLEAYGDSYHYALAYISIAKHLNIQGHYQLALDVLDSAQQVLESSYIPICESLLYEQLSVAYAGQNRKADSDFCRNQYLDILNDSRQNKELENRYEELAYKSDVLNGYIWSVVFSLLLLGLLFWRINKYTSKKNKSYVVRLQHTLKLCREITASNQIDLPLLQQKLDELLGGSKVQLRLSDTGVEIHNLCNLKRFEHALLHVIIPYIEWAITNHEVIDLLSNERMQLEKQKYIYEQHILENKRQNLAKKSCIGVVNSMIPFIDRIVNEVHKLTDNALIESTKVRRDRLHYIEELVDSINDYNEIVSLWVKMKYGLVSFHIESFSLNDLFQLVAQNKRSFEIKHQQLTVTSADMWVKADKALTLFMINTLVENARKYTQTGGVIKLEAEEETDYVEISISDNGRGLSETDVARITGEKVYDSKLIGLDNATDAESLKKAKGSGFGLMNCRGIIEKYRKLNPVFQVCTFQVESEIDRGSRFSFRLPKGIKNIAGICCILWSVLSCTTQEQHYAALDKSVAELSDSTTENLLDKASCFADSVYYSNIDNNYQQALGYADSAFAYLNKHYLLKHANDSLLLSCKGSAIPAELYWWNDKFDTDYHVILDVRNETAVAFLALHQLDDYRYNNKAYTALYKLQSEDHSIETYCRDLERSAVNRSVGATLIILLVLVGMFGYYFLYIKKRIEQRLNLEQVLEINRSILHASEVQPTHIPSHLDGLQREEIVCRRIPQQIIYAIADGVHDLFDSEELGIAVYNETSHQLEVVNNEKYMVRPSLVNRCFEEGEQKEDTHYLYFPLFTTRNEAQQAIGVFYIEKPTFAWSEQHLLLLKMIVKYIAVVIYRSMMQVSHKFRDIESAQDEMQKASWEENQLHVQNMVLDNCLSTIKHETIYYPNRIKQIVSKMNKDTEPDAVDLQSIAELISYYKGIFTILSSCAARQLDEVTFRRNTFPVNAVLQHALKYFKKKSQKRITEVSFDISEVEAILIGDMDELFLLVENLIDAALQCTLPGRLQLSANKENDFIRFVFSETRYNLSAQDAQLLFSPSLARMKQHNDLVGTEYLICKQILREHDAYLGHKGCRIYVEQVANQPGFNICFTIPAKG